MPGSNWTHEKFLWHPCTTPSVSMIAPAVAVCDRSGHTVVVGVCSNTEQTNATNRQIFHSLALSSDLHFSQVLLERSWNKRRGR